MKCFLSGPRARALALLAVVAAPLGWPSCASADDRSAPAAGSIVMLTGRGTAADPGGTVRALIKGAVVYNGEIINSSAATYINIRFSDGGMVLLRPNTRFKIADFRNLPPVEKPAEVKPVPEPASAPAPTKPALQQIANIQPGPGSRAFFHLLKGGFRAISGLIGRVQRDDYAVATPVATIGIRGTDYIAVLCDKTCTTDPVVLKAMPPGVNPEGGLVTGVKHGRIVVGTQGQCPANPPPGSQRSDCVEINGGEYHFTTTDGEQIDLPSEPHFLRVDPIPDPQSCVG